MQAWNHRESGSYDRDCAGMALELAERFKADTTLVLMMGGDEGHGFAMYAPNGTYQHVPDFLRFLAETIQDKWLPGQSLKLNS